MKKSVIFISLLILMVLFISACKQQQDSPIDDQLENVYNSEPTSGEEDTYNNCLRRCVEENSDAECSLNCARQYPQESAPDEGLATASDLQKCLGKCTDGPESDPLNCKKDCHMRRADSTKEIRDCGPLLNLEYNYGIDEAYSNYFLCAINNVGLTDPTICNRVEKTSINYNYCLKLVAVKSKDIAICELMEDKAYDPNYNICLEEAK